MPTDRYRLPPFKALLAFQAAATAETLARAAERLGVTESAVSHQVRHLERLLETNLFDRSGGRLRLTRAGAAYLARIEPALNALHEASEALRPAAGRNQVRITLPPSLAVTWLIPRLSQLEAAHPDLELQLVTTTRVLDLAREQIDLAIRYGRGGWPRVESEKLFEDMATPVCAPGYLAPGADPAEALAQVRLIVNRSIPGEWAEWAAARGLPAPALDEAVELDAIEQTLQLAEAGHGLAVGRAPFITDRLARGALIAPFGAGGPTGAAFYLCRPSEAEARPAVARVKRWLLAEADKASVPDT